ncbi:MAG: DUF6625 family protein [Bacteroidota bacterium]
MNAKTNIAFINCYFGQFPAYLNLFLQSCAHNPHYQFLLFSDAESPYPIPSNVRIIPFRFENLLERIEEKLGFPCGVTNPYKACDFKPAYGLLMEDFLTEFDYWGLCDLDMILGDFSATIQPFIDQGVDIFSSREEYFSGALAVLRNVPKINRLFLKSPVLQEVFQDEQFKGFDECFEAWHYLLDGGDMMESEEVKDSFSYLIEQERRNAHLTAAFQTNILESREQIFENGAEWTNGKVISAGKEYSAIHFVTTKRKFHFLLPKLAFTPSSLRVNKYGVAPGKGEGFAGLHFTYLKRPALLLEEGTKKTIQKLGLWS